MSSSFLLFLLFVVLVSVIKSVSERNKQAAKGKNPKDRSRNSDFEEDQRVKKQQESAAKPRMQSKPSNQGAASMTAAAAEGTFARGSMSATEAEGTSAYGSIDFSSDEGIDPCHEEQLSGLNAAEAVGFEPETRGEDGGIRLSFSKSDLVNGFVMGEILHRRAAR